MSPPQYRLTCTVKAAPAAPDTFTSNCYAKGGRPQCKGGQYCIGLNEATCPSVSVNGQRCGWWCVYPKKKGGKAGGCFPANAVVQSKRHGRVKIVDVKIGDEVMTHEGYSQVLFFAMRKPDAEAECTVIKTANSTLTLTGSHAVFKADGSAIQVHNVSIGLSLLSAGVVESLNTMPCTGLVAPVTRAGSLVVDGVTTSDYGPLAEWAGHGVAHTLMLPVRALHWALPSMAMWQSQNDDGRHPLMSWGQRLFGL